MEGFKQWRLSDGRLADVLILLTRDSVQLTALHKSMQSTGYFGEEAPAPPTAETTRGVFLGTKANVWMTQSAPQSIFTHNQAAISPSPSHAAAETGKNPDELKIHTEKKSPIKTHLQLLCNWAWVATQKANV